MFSSVLYPGMEFLIPLASDRCWLKCQRLVGWLSGGTWWTLYHNSDCRQTKWQQVDQIACWSRVCASSQLAESPLWVPQGIVFGFHSQMLHTRSRHAPPRISFILLMCPCHSRILLSQLALSSESQSSGTSRFSSCAIFQPQKMHLT